VDFDDRWWNIFNCCRCEELKPSELPDEIFLCLEFFAVFVNNPLVTVQKAIDRSPTTGLVDCDPCAGRDTQWSAPLKTLTGKQGLVAWNGK
jgi:hypothetical protein